MATYLPHVSHLPNMFPKDSQHFPSIFANTFPASSQHLPKTWSQTLAHTFSQHLPDIFSTCAQHLPNIFPTSSQHLPNMFSTCPQHLTKHVSSIFPTPSHTFSQHLPNITFSQHLPNITFSQHLPNITSSQHVPSIFPTSSQHVPNTFTNIFPTSLPPSKLSVSIFGTKFSISSSNTALGAQCRAAASSCAVRFSAAPTREANRSAGEATKRCHCLGENTTNVHGGLYIMEYIYIFISICIYIYNMIFSTTNPRSLKPNFTVT